MDATPRDSPDFSNSDSNANANSQDEAQARAQIERFRRLVEPAWPEACRPTRQEPLREPLQEASGQAQQNRDPSERRHGQPFMGRAVFDFGRREEGREAPRELPPPAIERAPCPLCGEPNRLRHAYCKRCGFRLPWAAAVEGLPESEPRLGRLDQVVERAITSSDAPGALCRFCAAKIAPYDRRCHTCGRWLSSNWNRAALDAWQPDFDRWNFSQVRGFRAGCLSPIVFIVALAMWRALT